jgi:hypothetical protein
LQKSKREKEYKLIAKASIYNSNRKGRKLTTPTCLDVEENEKTFLVILNKKFAKNLRLMID